MFRTGFSNGESLVVNYTDSEVECAGAKVGAKDWRLVGSR
ncbi:MAG: hypothetical protein K6G91_10595 [Kiritimatiellae bacterium]|nr:hypothetical protein [Kiritimatiellia bacterium]